MTATPAIVLDRVSKHYRVGGQEVLGVDGVSLSVPAGEFVSVMGPSGSGKSSLLNLIAGLDRPTEGRILFEGRDVAALTDDERTDLRLRRMGFVFQSFNLFPTFTVEENVLWPLEFLGVASRPARDMARQALAQVGLEDHLFGRRPSVLSGGEQQRVAMARALVTGPRVLLADEPTGNLDSRTGAVILDLLRRLNRECSLTVMMVTHSPFAATYGRRTIELRDGKVIRDVRPNGDDAKRVVVSGRD